MQNFDGKRVVVIGAGASGLAASRLLSQRGALVWLVDEGAADLGVSEVRALESLGVAVCLEYSGLPCVSWDLAVVSPGVGRASGLRRQLLQLGVPAISEIELAFRFAEFPLAAITGTNGKTTTALLAEAALRGGGRRTLVAGNIGRPFCSVAGDCAGLDCVVLEVSSFQLELVDWFKPKVAVLLNLAPDHLDRYESYDDYCRAKARIFENQGEEDWAIVQWEAKEFLAGLGIEFGSRVLTFSARNPAADVFFDRGLLVSRIPGWSGTVYDCGGGRLAGAHNAENLMAALLVGRALGLELSGMQLALMKRRGEPHRFEVLEPVKGVQVINDSKATNPGALRAAIEAADQLLGAAGRLWLIAGGLNKRLPFQGLGPLIAAKVAGAFLFGQDGGEIGATLGRFTKCSLCRMLDDAAAAAFEQTCPGDVVLFSPGCASFDQFRNYAERGDRFCSLVDALRLRQSVDGNIPFHGKTQISKESSVRGAFDFADVAGRSPARTGANGIVT